MRVLVVTGAGISAESGIPTFREFLAGLGAEWIREPAASALPRLVAELTATGRRL